jgi:hypothetical protein
MDNIFGFILSFFVSQGVPEKKEFNSVKIFILIIILIVVFNLVYYTFFE